MGRTLPLRMRQLDGSCEPSSESRPGAVVWQWEDSAGMPDAADVLAERTWSRQRMAACASGFGRAAESRRPARRIPAAPAVRLHWMCVPEGRTITAIPDEWNSMEGGGALLEPPVMQSAAPSGVAYQRWLARHCRGPAAILPA